MTTSVSETKGEPIPMYRIAGLTLVLLAAVLAACSSDDDDHMNGDHMDGSGTMDHGSMNHESMNHEGTGDADATAALPADANRVCPVTGDEVSPEIFTEYEGKKVYFCCDDCVEKFQNSPEEYFAKAYPDAGK